MKSKIDFVIIWVDGNDPEWQAERSKFKLNNQESDNNIHRFRDWENLQYWFRAVEKFTPWVNKVHFVTCGHLPKWLNKDNKKLNIVKHDDYIPAKYLPTFSSHTIELNLHRINGLEEKFVYFNDDTFIINTMKEKEFFVDDLPCDSAVLNVHCYSIDEMFVMAPFRDVGVINRYFNMKEVMAQNPLKWYNIKYGINSLRNFYLLPCPRFPGFLQPHLPVSYLKKTFSEVWDREGEILDATCSNKFRNISDVNQWVFREWQLAKNEFHPRKLSIGKSITLGDKTYLKAANYIKQKKYKMICINDADMSDEDFEIRKEAIKQAFQSILPEKSSFEK